VTFGLKQILDVVSWAHKSLDKLFEQVHLNLWILLRKQEELDILKEEYAIITLYQFYRQNANSHKKQQKIFLKETAIRFQEANQSAVYQLSSFNF